MRKHLTFAAQAVVSVGLLALLFRRLDISALRTLYTTMPLWFYLLSLAVVMSGQVLYAWRWRQVLAAAGVSVTIGTAIQQYFIGIFLNNFFPSTVGGDMAKVYYLGRLHGYRPIAASIVLDRLLSIGLLAVLATTMYWVAPDPSPQFVATRAVVTAMAAMLILFLVLAARGTGGLPERLSRFGTLAVGLAERAQRFRHDMAAAAKRPQIMLQSAAVVTTYFFALTARISSVLCDQHSGASRLPDAAHRRHDGISPQQPAGVCERARSSRATARAAAAAARRSSGSRGGYLPADLRAPARLEPARARVLASASGVARQRGVGGPGQIPTHLNVGIYDRGAPRCRRAVSGA